MNKNYKNCEKGHFYPANLGSCPHCDAQNDSGFIQPEGNGRGIDDTDKTAIMGNKGDSTPGTMVADNQRETPLGETIPLGSPVSGYSGSADRTVVFSGTGKKDDEKGSQPTSARKLVGWLVSYTITEFGVDFRLYEGQNNIGRDSSCTIRITEDSSISSKHATILFRNDQFYLRDEMSTNPSFVNGEEVMPGNTVRLNDGDSITIGKTELLVRASQIKKTD